MSEDDGGHVVKGCSKTLYKHEKTEKVWDGVVVV